MTVAINPSRRNQQDIDCFYPQLYTTNTKQPNHHDQTKPARQTQASNPSSPALGRSTQSPRPDCRVPCISQDGRHGCLTSPFSAPMTNPARPERPISALASISPLGFKSMSLVSRRRRARKPNLRKAVPPPKRSPDGRVHQRIQPAESATSITNHHPPQANSPPSTAKHAAATPPSQSFNSPLHCTVSSQRPGCRKPSRQVQPASSQHGAPPPKHPAHPYCGKSNTRSSPEVEARQWRMCGFLLVKPHSCG